MSKQFMRNHTKIICEWLTMIIVLLAAYTVGAFFAQ